MRKLNAQQITEFMLAAPLLVIFFIVLTEFAFAFNANLTLNNAVSSSSSAIISAINTENEKSDFENAVQTYILTDLQNNNIPNTGTVNTSFLTVKNYPAVIAAYTYKPGFNYAFLPALRSINMISTSVFPFQIPNTEGYNNGISTEELDLLGPQEAPDNSEEVE